MEKINSLISEGKLELAHEESLKLYENQPDDPEVNYLLARINDRLGKEIDAIPYYIFAIDNGLEEGLLGAYVGLGSTYRSLGKYNEAEQVFKTAKQYFPEAKVLTVFEAMTLYNLGKNNDAVSGLIKLVLDDTTDEEIVKYSRALSFYADNLDAVY